MISTDIINMKRINNKIKNKHQTTFLTETNQPLFVKTQKRIKSLNPHTSGKITSNKISIENITTRLSYLNPFSHYQNKVNFNEQLNGVVCQFKNLSKKNILNGYLDQTRYADSNCKTSTKDFNTELRQIIKRSKAKGNRKRSQYQTLEKKRSKTTEQIYDDIQKQSANNLIQQSKRQKQYFKQEMDKFNHLLHDTSAVFIQKWNINIKPKKVKQVRVNQLINKNLVNLDHKDEVYFYEENYLASRKDNYRFGKQIGIFLKSKDRVMKTEQDQFCITRNSQNTKVLRDNLKSSIKQPESDEKGVLGNYFSNKRSKRELLKTSIQNCSQI